jgi:hypothetical protein
LDQEEELLNLPDKTIMETETGLNVLKKEITIHIGTQPHGGISLSSPTGNQIVGLTEAILKITETNAIVSILLTRSLTFNQTMNLNAAKPQLKIIQPLLNGDVKVLSELVPQFAKLLLGLVIIISEME